MSFILVLISLMLLLDMVWWFFADTVSKRSLRRGLWRSIVASFAVFQIATLAVVLISRIVSDRVDEQLGLVVMTLIFLWHFMGLPILLIGLLLSGFLKLLPKRKVEPAPESSEESPTISRRGFLATAVAVPPVLTLAGAGYAIGQQHDFRVRRFELPMPRLPRALDGLTIAHVSDTHVGGFTRGVVLDKIIDQTNQLNADLVLFTGDLINHALSDLPGAVDMLQRIRYRHALLVCEGNHDLIENRFAFEAYVRERKLPILINEAKTISIRENPIQVLGLRWGGLGARSVRSREHGDELIAQSMGVLTPNLDPNAFQILLAHHPHAFDVAAKNRIPLTLSGHTHGGQLMLTDSFGFGPAMYRYWSGLYEKDESKLLVSNGVGNWFPLRINAPAEILHLTLRSA